VLAVLAMPAAPLRARDREARTLDASLEVIEQMARAPDRGIPPALFKDAHAVAVIPNVIKAGFVVGGRHGRGVVLARDEKGVFSNPVFLTLTGGSVGWQAGAQSTDLVLVFKTRRSVERILQGRNQLTLGADAGVAAGPVGRQVAAATDAQLKAEVYSYSRSRGLFGGVSLDGDALLVDWRGNADVYRRRGVTPADILAEKGIAAPLEAARLRAALMNYATLKEVPK
jgi:lipid-binding SYLF domain-containing protein